VDAVLEAIEEWDEEDEAASADEPMEVAA
jgi:hypothetical protein